MILEDRYVRAAAFSNGPVMNRDTDLLCCFWDLESTGLSVQGDDIIQIGATCRLYKQEGRRCLFDWVSDSEEEDHDFCEYITTRLGVPEGITALTGITDVYLAEQGKDLRTALDRWLAWLHSLLKKCRPRTQIWFIAHNGNQFDLPLLFHQEMNLLRWHPGTFLKQVGVTGIVDSLVLSRALYFAAQQHKGPGGPVTRLVSQSHRLSDLYRTRFGSRIPHEHNALYDAKAIQCVMGQEPFSSAWCQYLIGWRTPEYIKAFYKAFNRSRSESSRQAPELQVNRHLFGSIIFRDPAASPASPPWTPSFHSSWSTREADNEEDSPPLSAPPAGACLAASQKPVAEVTRTRAFRYWQGFRTKIK